MSADGGTAQGGIRTSDLATIREYYASLAQQAPIPGAGIPVDQVKELLAHKDLLGEAMRAGLRCVFPPVFDPNVLVPVMTLQLPAVEYRHGRCFGHAGEVAINGWGVEFDESFEAAFSGMKPIRLNTAGNVTVCYSTNPKDADRYEDMARPGVCPCRSLPLARVWQYLHAVCQHYGSLVNMHDNYHAFVRVPNAFGAHVVVTAMPKYVLGKPYVQLSVEPLNELAQAGVLVYAS